jgi:hypothetical protein
MLWQLATPRLNTLSNAHLVALLSRDPRGPDPSVDLALLRPTGLRVLGRDAWARVISDAEAVVADETIRARVSALR